MLLFNQILVYSVLVFLFIALYWNLIKPGFTFLIGVMVLGVFRVISPADILSGFANEQIAVIIMLLILGNIYRQSSVLDILFDKIFDKTKTYKGFLTRMTLLVAPLSAFLNNTPLVALLMPYVEIWSKRNHSAPSKLLIPLSYVTILGGCITLIGTSTHLIVNGLVLDQTIIPNLPSLNLFDFFAVGSIMLVIGFLYLFFFGNLILPSCKSPVEEFAGNERTYFVEARIKEGSQLVGKTIEEAKLRNLEGLYLFKVIRKGVEFDAVPNETILEGKDTLLFTGDTSSVSSLLDINPSLEIPSVGMYGKRRHTNVIEVVVSHNSQLINRTLKSENFRAKYDATAIAIHRNGEKLSGNIGRVVIKAGDTILLLAGPDFKELVSNTSDFYFISTIKQIQRLGVFRTLFLVLGTVAVIALSSFKIITLFMGLLVFLSLLVGLKITTPKSIAASIDFELALIIAMSLALGIAMVKTQVADGIATLIVHWFSSYGGVGLLAGIYLITAILSAFITNKAAVAIIFPISLTLAKDLNLPPLPFILVVSFAAAANFMTPVGYQTNTMVFGPGGYKYKHFLQIGTPLTIIYMIVTIVVLNYLYL